MSESQNYLDYKDKFSQVWHNRYTVALALIIVKLYLFKISLVHAIEALSKSLVSTVDQYNKLNRKFNQLPAQYADTINQLVINQVNALKKSSVYFLLILFKCCVAVIKFIIELVLGTILCLITQFIQGFIDFSLDVVSTVLEMVNTIVKAATVLIQQGLKGFNDIVEEFSSTVNSVSNFFTNNDAINTTSLTRDINSAVRSLNNISIPSSVFDEINSLSSKIPDFDDLEEDALDRLTSPVFKLISHINESTHFSPISMRSLNNNSMTIKSTDLDPTAAITFIKESEDSVNYVFKVILIILCCTAALAVVVMAFKEFFGWKRKFNMYLDVSEHNAITEFQFFNSLNTYTNSVLYYAVHKFHFDMGNKSIWFVSYITSTYSMFLVAFTAAGAFTLVLQYALLSQAQKALKEFPMDTLTSQAADSANATAIQFMRNTNSFIRAQEYQINQDLFGELKSTSGTLSDSIDLFVSALNSTLIEPFGNTPFESPVSSLVYCIFTRKLIMVSNAFSWIEDNLKISIPELPASITATVSKSLSKSTTIELSFQKEIDDLFAWFRKTLLIECCIVGGVGCIWVVSAIIGLSMLILRSRKVPIGGPKRLTVREKLEYGLPFDRLP